MIWDKGLPGDERISKIRLAVLTQYRSVIDRRDGEREFLYQYRALCSFACVRAIIINTIMTLLRLRIPSAPRKLYNSRLLLNLSSLVIEVD